MTTYLGKSCSFGLPRVPFVNCRQFMYLVISLLVLRAGCELWLYQFQIIAYLWCAVDFNNLKFISSSNVDVPEITCSCIFSRAVYDLFSMCFVLHVLTINEFFFFFFFFFIFFFFHIFFFFFFHECSLQCKALYFDIHGVFNYNFLKDNETF